MPETLKSINPATLEVIGEVPIADEAQVRQAVAWAREAQPAWAEKTYRERAQYVLAFRDQVRDHLDELAQLITKENGKPLAESISSDIMPLMELCTYVAKHTEKTLRRQRIWLGKWDWMGRSSSIEYSPLGTVGIISPWNYPLSIPGGQVMMAVMAGNTAVLKPSEHTPLVGDKIAQLARRARFPNGVIEVVSGDGQTGAALLSAGVDKVLFTGSVATGKKIMAACAESLTPVVLELGGKDPMIVLDDADVEVAASAAVWGAFSNNGQTCASVERLYVDKKVAQTFINKVVAKTKALSQGSGLDLNSDVSTLNNQHQLSIVERQVQAAIADGARAMTGGERTADRQGYYYPPTVLVDVSHKMEVVRDETFGPVLPIMVVESEAEAIRLSNDSPYGLTASVWTKDLSRGRAVARQLAAGTVTINENVYTYALPQTPWGGPKFSGIGRTHGEQGLLELVEPQHIHVNRMTRMKDLWWYSYDQTRYGLLRAMAFAFYGKGIWGKLQGWVGFLSRVFRLKVN